MNVATQLYYSIFTKQGLALLTESIQNGTKLGITSMAFGDGGGTLPVPSDEFESLVNEVYRTQINSLAPDPNNANWLRAESIISSSIGGFNIRELGLYAGDTLIAYSNYPPTFKPNPSDGTARIMTFRMVLQIDNISSFELVIDPDIVLATIQYVNENLLDKNIKLRNGRKLDAKILDSVSLEDFCILDGISDDTENFTKAISIARSENKKLLSYGGKLLINQDVSLRDVNFDLSSTIILVDDCILKCGSSGGTALTKTQKLGMVYKKSGFSFLPDLHNKPSVQILGSKCLNFHFDQIDYLQLYASTDPKTYPKDSSIGYCNFYGSLVVKLEFNTDVKFNDSLIIEDGAGSKNQWINSNNFFISRLIAVDILGSYAHNGNIFYGGCFETRASRINIQHGNKNYFTGIRGEGYPDIIFSEKTEGNIVERVWFGSIANATLWENVTDKGALNKTATTVERHSDIKDILILSADNDNIFNNTLSKNNREATRKRITAISNYGSIAQTELFSMQRGDMLYFLSDTIDENKNTHYGVKILFFDKNKKKISLSSSDYKSGNFLTIGDGFIEGGLYGYGAPYIFLTNSGHDKVKYISVIISSGLTARSTSKNISILLSSMTSKLNNNRSKVIQKTFDRIALVKPTRFVGSIGDIIIGMKSNFKCVFTLETTVISQISTNTLTLSEVSDIDIGSAQIGDLIGIDLSDASTFWTTIEAISGNRVTLKDVIKQTTTALAGTSVYISRLE